MIWLDSLVERHPGLKACLGDMEKAFELMAASYRQGGKLLVCGNGGSAADSEHIVGELMKGFLKKRPLPLEMRRKLEQDWPKDGSYLADHLQEALPAISLSSQISLQTAFANDVAADLSFAQQVVGYGRPGDVLLGISTSGNSKNVLYALQVSRVLGLGALGLTGPDGGMIKAVCDVTICAPGENTPQVQEMHIAI